MKIAPILSLSMLATLMTAALAPLSAVAFTETQVHQQRGTIVQLRSDAPTEYVVKKGDTLWAIAETFLQDPWLWPQLWQINEAIDNPHLIYPGDKLTIIWRDGQPYLSRKAQQVLLPSGEVARKEQAIAMFAGAWLQPFMVDHHMVASSVVAQAPAVLGDNRTASQVNGLQPVFVKAPAALGSYRIYHAVATLGDYQLLRYVARAQLEENYGSTVAGPITHLQREVKVGDVLLQTQAPVLPEQIVPTSGLPLDGQIVAALNDRMKQGKYDIVVLPHGAASGVEIGQMYQAVRPGVEVFASSGEQVDRWKPADVLSRNWRQTTQLPVNVTAELLVLQVHPHHSFAMVVDGEDWLQVGDYFVPKYID